MTPDYLMELADIADPDKLWQLGAIAQSVLPPEKRHQLDTGVALRRHAEHVRRIQNLVGTGMSLLTTPMGSYNHTDSRSVRMSGQLRRRVAELEADKPKGH